MLIESSFCKELDDLILVLISRVGCARWTYSHTEEAVFQCRQRKTPLQKLLLASVAGFEGTESGTEEWFGYRGQTLILSD